MRDKKEKCKDCGFRIRSKNHESGNHHKKGSDGKYSIIIKSKRRW